ncbi:MupA/Atu3671 family FMN-dependent luciferase-like monooxygenase [Rathayibacter iranicus]|uniref:LLM class flavin-dependent oxidoreductase n=2 Tax=Rathayibacter iranicus TaxID=59737 RepID=A0AAD1ACV0_9MICO|nr:MupA/Atu3671 family FMN-dependent luciferase-like monooxygenase [Rathayibacter iranicus]AZZ56046.1 LLM class flavin-dependent oxidoreductase [Rathayibacter iranicus]MWV30266.1 LLM class flavin-dependent oxidoreductase [Rathayibacter iranicus NCPPB 2253 = VKM Ac-1602]PPI46400.1 hypothetical protein C5E09_08255 [Rathayibacter iranicus]PPI59923.1 hypothetical protein C5E08_09180 [Rathayibacter iranicus]PPI71391.1 hypothetical protein C5E01_08220 [Rathayibacter iranicus]
MPESIYLDPERLAKLTESLRKRKAVVGSADQPAPAPRKTPDLGVIFFSGSADGRDPYALLLDAARLIDDSGFTAIWTPERHFTDVGGSYPNPSVLGAALAMVTKNVRIRAGSVNLPLHDVLRVAEEWALVDNLSHGRVDLAVAPGWHTRDFVLNPGAFDDRSGRLNESRKQLQSLWRGDTLSRTDPHGESHSIVTYPRPIQPELPIWLTTSQRTEAWEFAGREGFNVLSALINFGPKDLEKRITIYREARAQAGYNPASGVVSLMLHTYVGLSVEQAVERARPAMTEYLSSFVSQHSTSGQSGAEAKAETLQNLGDDRDDFMEMVFQRYVSTSSLIGDATRVTQRMEYFRSIGVDEIACLVDFGLTNDEVLASLGRLAMQTKTVAAS